MSDETDSSAPKISEGNPFARFAGKPKISEGNPFAKLTTGAGPKVSAQPTGRPSDPTESVWGSSPDQPIVSPTLDSSAASRLASGVVDPVWGGAQMLAKITPAPAERAINKLNNWIAEKTGLVAPVPPGGVDEMVRKREAEIEAERGGAKGTDWPRLVGNVVSPATYAAGTGSTLARAALSGATSAALQPETGKPEDYWRHKGTEAALGGLTGMAGLKGAQAIAGAIAPETGKAAQTLLKEGVALTPGQIMGGAAKRAEDAMASHPPAGLLIRSGQRESLDSFNIAAMNRALSPIGETVPAGVPAGHDAFKYVSNVIDRAYGEVLPKTQGQLDIALRDEIKAVRDLMTASDLPQKQKDVLADIVDNKVLRKFSDTGAISGRSFKDVDSELGALAREFKQGEYFDRELYGAVREVQESLRRMIQRLNPEQAPALRKIDEGYANMLILEDAVVAAAKKEGVFTTDQLITAAKDFDSSKGKKSTARGEALMQDLTRAGSAVLPRTVPDSGTAERLFWSSLLGAMGMGSTHAPGSSVLVPALATGAAASFPYSRLGMAAIRSWAQPDPWRKAAASPFREAAPALPASVAAMLRDYGLNDPTRTGGAPRVPTAP